MIDNTEKRAEAAKAAEAGKAAAKGAANAAEGQAKAAAGKLASAFSDLKGDAAALLKGLKDSLGIPDLPKFPKKPAFKELKKFKPKTPPEPKAFQKEEKKFEFGKAAPVTTPAPKPAPPEPVLVETYKGYQIYKKQQGPFVQFFTKSGERIVRTGPESRSASDDELLKYEKAAIDARISKLSSL
jgi:hypothetical protein